jgi:transcriptional regulator with XRE-family HTH domain
MDPIVVALVECRRERGLSQMWVAGRSGIFRRTLAAYESGSHEPGLDALCRWADALDADIALVWRQP